jgi:hypothetical protein
MQHPIKPTIVAIYPTTSSPNNTKGCLETIKTLAWMASRALNFQNNKRNHHNGK